MPAAPWGRRKRSRVVLPTVSWDDVKLGMLLDEGTYGRVFACRLRDQDDELAVKVSRSEPQKTSSAANVEVWRSVMREAALQWQIGAHPNVQPLLALVARPAFVAIVMPRCATTLADVLTTGTLEPLELQRLALGLARGLAHMHDRGILHCDIKQANVLVGAKENPNAVRLADFGLARRGAGERCVASALLRPVASLGYRAPELLAQPAPLRVDIASDLWALGCVFLELILGRPAPVFWPHTGRTPLQEIAVALGPLPRNLAARFQEVAELASLSPPHAYVIRAKHYHERAGDALVHFIPRLLSWSAGDRPAAAMMVEGLARIEHIFSVL